MELYVYDAGLNQLGVLDGFTSLRWRRRFFEPGEFELHVPATEENLSLLSAGHILHRLDRREAGVMEGIKITSDEQSGDEITATGRMASSLLGGRIITPSVSFSGTVEDAMRKIVGDNAVTSRPIDFLTLGEAAGFTPTCNFQTNGKNVLSVLESLGKSAPLGFRLRLNPSDRQWVFEVYSGTDRTITQTETPYILFSDGFSNISSPSYTLDTTGYCNVAYVRAENASGEEILVEVDRTNGEARRELWVDAADAQQNDLPDAEFQEQLRQRGLQHLAEAARSESFEASAIDADNFRYRTDWDLGDIVSFEKWGQRLDQRMTEVEEVYEDGIVTITPVCGNPLPETLDLGSDT